MSRIRVLESNTANQIAAGEVIERPASVIKELVENALDAGARRISIEITAGGRELIRVSDDGCGMDADDAVVAFQRHATSKISTIADLMTSTSLGFRGEALPSIASVARVRLRTKPPGQASGTEVEVVGGEHRAPSEIGCATGTLVEVRDLFFNTPARLKYLRTDATEAGRVAEVVQNLALAHPDVAVSLRVDGRELLNTPGDGQDESVIVATYGYGVWGQLIPVAWEGQDLSISGYISRPSLERRTRSHQHFFVNGRSVRGGILIRALEDGYGELLPKGRHPVAILRIRLDPGAVDVNVHPAKAEVRFRDERAVFMAVREGVREAVLARLPIPEIQRGANRDQPNPFPASPASPGGRHRPGNSTTWDSGGSSSLELPFVRALADNRLAATNGSSAVGQPLTGGEYRAEIRYLGQLGGRYLLAAADDGLLVVDQHAAHERVLFESLLAVSPESASQTLLTPLTVELTAAERATLDEHRPLLAELGLRYEDFGGGAILIREAPARLAGGFSEKAVLELLGELTESGQSGSREVAAALAACHRSVRANQVLTAVEAQALLDQLQACESPLVCPHGRPTMLRLTYRELEKHFSRR